MHDNAFHFHSQQDFGDPEVVVGCKGNLGNHKGHLTMGLSFKVVSVATKQPGEETGVIPVAAFSQ